MNNIFHRKCQERDTFTVRRMHEPTQAERLMQSAARGMQNIMAGVALTLFLLMLGGYAPELWRMM